jgi:hypothetical protein
MNVDAKWGHKNADVDTCRYIVGEGARAPTAKSYDSGAPLFGSLLLRMTAPKIFGTQCKATRAAQVKTRIAKTMR